MEKQQAERAAGQGELDIFSWNCNVSSQIYTCKLLTLWEPIGGNAPALGMGPTRGLFVGGGGRAPLVGPHA